MAFYNGNQIPGLGANITLAPIDETYNPESKNAQSGIAVAEAISTKANLQFKEIDNIDVTLFDGNSFKKPDIYTVLSTKVIESGAVDVMLSSGFNLWCDTEGIFKEGCHYLIDAHLTEDSGDGITHWRTNYFAEVIDLEDKVNVADIDQSFNPESENAQSGKAVAEALKSKVLVDVTLTEEQVASGISGISVAIEDIEAYHNAKQVNIYVEMPFKEKALPSSTIAINVSDGAAYADFYGWQHGVTCPQGNTLYWHIFNVRESFHKSNGKKNMCSYYRAPVYYEGPNSLGTCSCLYGEVVHLANLKNHPPKLNLYWSSGGATLEAGTRIFVEVYE